MHERQGSVPLVVGPQVGFSYLERASPSYFTGVSERLRNVSGSLCELHEYMAHGCLKRSLAFRKPAVAAPPAAARPRTGLLMAPSSALLLAAPCSASMYDDVDGPLSLQASGSAPGELRARSVVRWAGSATSGPEAHRRRKGNVCRGG